MDYATLYRRSIEQPEQFWAEQAKAIHGQRPPQAILDYDDPPFRRWFGGGLTNLCHNAVDRHLPERAAQLALVAVSSETGQTREFTYAQLHAEVNAFAAVLLRLDVQRGDRVVVYMPNMAEAVFAMLACARIGAVHSVVFGRFAAHNLALRIDQAQGKPVIDNYWQTETGRPDRTSHRRPCGRGRGGGDRHARRTEGAGAGGVRDAETASRARCREHHRRAAAAMRGRAAWRGGAAGAGVSGAGVAEDALGQTAAAFASGARRAARAR